MTGNTPALFRSGGRNGYSDAIKNDPHHIEARKRPRHVQVRFAETECTVQTREGVVHARPGDALLTGTAGEHWRVSRRHFTEKYEPVDPKAAGAAGSYRALPYRVLALHMRVAFDVLLSDGVSRLSGHPGDWLIDYGDGSFGVVAPSIFEDTYEALG